LKSASSLLNRWLESTHVLRLDFGLAFAQSILNVFILSSFVASETFDEIVQRFFEPDVFPSVVGLDHETLRILTL
jgi:hypothetical protein